jgi:hypothetical protein
MSKAEFQHMIEVDCKKLGFYAYEWENTPYLKA